MIYAERATEVDALTEAFAAGLVGSLGVTVLDSLAAVAQARTTAGIAEVTPGIYSARFTAPAEPGAYVVQWDDGADPPAIDSEALRVTGVDPDALEWAPTVQDVADVSPAFTRGPVSAGGAERNVFDETTDPSAIQVQGLISAACEEVSGRVGIGMLALAAFADLARSAARWHAAASIEAEKSPGGTETEGAYRWKQASYVANLNELVAQARRGSMRLA